MPQTAYPISPATVDVAFLHALPLTAAERAEQDRREIQAMIHRQIRENR